MNGGGANAAVHGKVLKPPLISMFIEVVSLGIIAVGFVFNRVV
jgi:hypothetical protein